MLHWTHTDKWQRYQILSSDSEIKPYLPETVLFSHAKMFNFLNRFSSIYLKPINGTGGNGIIKISKEDNLYKLFYRNKVSSYSNANDLANQVKYLTQNTSYMIQQGIDLLTINSRLIDFRVLILKPDKEWEEIGIIGKIAPKKFIVTNKAKGGSPILFQSALVKGLRLSRKEISKLEQKLFSIGIKVGNTLSKSFRYVREIGMDVAIDQNGHIWILETNSMPKYKLFLYQSKDLYNIIDAKVRYIRRNYRNKRL